MAGWRNIQFFDDRGDAAGAAWARPAGALATGLAVSAVLAGLNWVVMRLWVFRS